MRAHLNSFPALLIEVAIALGLVYWIWNVEAMVFVATAAAIALLYRIMLMMEAIVSRAPYGGPTA